MMEKDFCWRHLVLLTAIAAPLVWLLSLPPLSQQLGYHDFADDRAYLSIPNFFDVLSNLPFLFVGLSGIQLLTKQAANSITRSWQLLFIGVTLVSLGSSYYHWNPSNDTLVWDRLPMTLGFMGLFVALMGEFVSRQLCKTLLPVAALFGVATVFYWHWFDDLRPYLWVQLAPLLAIPTAMTLFKHSYSHGYLLVVALAWYLLAKIVEIYDREIFSLTANVVSGHTLKHLFAAAGCYSIYLMLKRRKHLDP